MEHLLKEINEVLNAFEQERNVFIAIAFLHGMRTALELNLNKEGCKEEKQC